MATRFPLSLESESHLLRRVYRLRYADRTLGGDARSSFSFCFRLDFVFGPVVTVFPRGRCEARSRAASSRFPDRSSRSVADRWMWSLNQSYRQRRSNRSQVRNLPQLGGDRMFATFR